MMVYSKQFFFYVVLGIFCLLYSSAAFAATDVLELPLLAVQEHSNGSYEGSTAQLFLELHDGGSGRVFLDTYPLTKVDTQVSTRFAKEVACDTFLIDCSTHDFIYTLRAGSPIIGGPSAGAALSALTTIGLLDLEYDRSIAVTGTINSGGVIGQVGGIREKVQAAAAAGLSKVLLPQGSLELLEQIAGENESVDSFDQEAIQLSTQEYDDQLAQASLEFGIEIREVATIWDLVFELTGIQLIDESVDLQISEEYNQIMSGLANQLCERTDLLEQEYDLRVAQGVIDSDPTFEKQLAVQFERAINASSQNDFYSAASFCFGQNIVLANQLYQSQEMSSKELQDDLTQLLEQIAQVRMQVEQQEMSTISDLQTVMVVEERLNEVEERLEDFETSTEQEAVLAYAQERLYSAISWMNFFGMSGRAFDLTTDQLASSCQAKLSEAKEQFQYISVVYPTVDLRAISSGLAVAERALESQDYSLCLVQASQAKAEANTVVSSISLTPYAAKEYLETKSEVTELIIARSIQEGVFPILGYSYYQYAHSFSENEPYTALLYLEYALELSDLDIYFLEQDGTVPHLISSKQPIKIGRDILLFSFGIIFGILLSIAYVSLFPPTLRRKSQKSRR